MPNDNIKLKNGAIAAFLVFLAVVILYSLFFGPAKKFGDSLFPAKTIAVSAEGKVVVEPDIAAVSFSVVSEGADPEKIADENNRKISMAIDFIKSQGVDAKDIKTTQYNLQPKYEYDEKNRKSWISGYTLTQTVLMKIRDLSKVGKILAGLPEAGINQIGSISFDVDDPEKYLSEARNQAFEKAKIKAGEMAEKNGVKLGKVINFSEYQGGVRAPPIPYFEALRKGGDATAITPSIQPGAQEVTVQVSVTYEIK
jgi:uncharacterized protein YggE